MLALISPSKTLDFEKKISIDNFSEPFFKKEIFQLIDVLKNKSQSEIAKLMDLSEKLAKLNFDRYNNFKPSFNLKNSKPCIYAFKGDVYEGLDIESLTKKEQDLANNKFAIISGLYGLLKPFDLIQPYRLEMSVKLKNKIGNNLYDFWGEKITQQLNEEENNLVVNLASKEYFSAIKPKKLKANLVNVDFKENKNGKLSTIGIFAKRARGLMARFIIKNNISKASDLLMFDYENYKFNKKISTENNFIFVR
jgi:hypothetical protein